MFPENLTTIFIVDEDLVALKGIQAILDNMPGIRVIGVEGNWYTAQKTILEKHPKVILLDVKMLQPNIFSRRGETKTDQYEPIFIALTEEVHAAYLTAAIDGGARGILNKKEIEEKLAATIQQALSGANLFTEEQLAQANLWRQEALEKWKKLTGRERQTLRLLLEGYGNKHIAETLGISVKTAAYHVSNILRKLGLSSRMQVMVWARENFPEGFEYEA